MPIWTKFGKVIRGSFVGVSCHVHPGAPAGLHSNVFALMSVMEVILRNISKLLLVKLVKTDMLVAYVLTAALVGFTLVCFYIRPNSGCSFKLHSTHSIKSVL